MHCLGEEPSNLQLQCDLCVLTVSQQYYCLLNNVIIDPSRLFQS